jgi:hypothetical protein
LFLPIFLPGQQQQQQPAENGANIVTSLSPRISKRPDYFIFILFYFSSGWRNGESCVSPSTSTSLLFSRFTVVCVCVSLVAVIVSIVNVADGRRFS